MSRSIALSTGDAKVVRNWLRWASEVPDFALTASGAAALAQSLHGAINAGNDGGGVEFTLEFEEDDRG